MRLFIVGLQRSGTTITWSTFRRDSRFVAYNEPFNPLIKDIDDPSWLHRPWYEETRRLWEADSAGFWDLFAPIQGLEQLQEGMTAAQERWLATLLDSGEHTVFDLTRCGFKLKALHAAAPDAVLVHLHRAPASLVSSIQLPTRSNEVKNATGLGKLRMQARAFARRTLNERTFWDRDVPALRFFEAIGPTPGSLFGRRLAEVGLDPAQVYTLSTTGQLLAYWRIHVDRVERDGPALFGERFVSLSLERFCDEPQAAVHEIYERLGAQPPADLDVSGIRPARPGHLPGDPRWEKLYEQVGIDAARYRP